MDLRNDPRFKGIEPFEKKLWLASPTMHGEEQKWVDEAIVTNWVSTVGANINEAQYGNSKADFIVKLHIALKETAETEYWLHLLHKSDYIDSAMFKSLLDDCLEIKRILIASINTAKERKTT